MITLGIDEVGRGCWAGPLVAGAVVLNMPIPGVKDSKKLSKTSRIMLAEQIYASGAAVGLGWVWPAEIDTHGLTWAVATAMTRAVAEVTVPYDEIVIDGNINYLLSDPRSHAVIKADDSVPCVSAASIVAKVARDTYMAELGAQYTGYGFAEHVGYGTRQHIEALQRLGVSDIHRLSYKPIKALLA
jgi:ribonuclease HII